MFLLDVLHYGCLRGSCSTSSYVASMPHAVLCRAHNMWQKHALLRSWFDLFDGTSTMQVN